MKSAFTVPRLSWLACLIAAITSSSTLYPLAAFAADTGNVSGDKTAATEVLSFDPVFLSKAPSSQVDLKRFERGASAMPGDYPADIFVNDISIGKNTITFREQPDKSVALCLTPGVIKQMGLDYRQLKPEVRELLKNDDAGCQLLSQVLPDASPVFDSGAQRLDISVPQALIKNAGRGYVSPELWDSGVPAATLGYNSNFYTTKSNGQELKSGYVGLNSGVNIGAWYFRHNGNYNWQDDTGGKYQRINTYVQRDIAQIGGRLVLGENNTSGQVFDSLPYTGGELIDDDRMRPQSERGFAPEIRGIARTNARVTVRQNGQIIYDTTVAPGAFVINDLYPTGYGGDLDVTVTEADNSTQTFSVPYSSVSQLLRPGSSHYDMVIGKLNDDSISDDPQLYQLTYQRGLSNLFTGYGGLQLSTHYYALELGTALNTPLGALAFDSTQSRTHLNTNSWEGMGYDNSMSGQSYRVSLSKYIQDTKSNISIAAYRFSTSGYMDFRTAMQTVEAIDHGDNPGDIYRPKNKLTITANQGLPDGWGQFYSSGYVQDYWNRDTGSDLQYQVGYSNWFHNVSYSFNAGRSRNGDGDIETTFLFNISMPLGSSDQQNKPQLNASITRDGSGNTGELVGISGTGGADHQYSYGVSGSHYNNGIGSSGTANGQYRSPYTNIMGSVSTGDGYNSASAGLSGTVIGFEGGAVFTPYTGDTFAIVEAKGASGARVGNYSGVTVDHWGHAAVPYLNPYEMNEIDLDPKGLPYDVELETTSQKVAPHAGAVVRLKYPTQRGYPVLIAAHTAGNGPIPFGAEVTDSKGNVVGSVGQGSVIYARVENERDHLRVIWGSGDGQQCGVSYMLTPLTENAPATTLNRFNTVCN
ncbi:fimbria/pilus outer membrane usher protein [Citrobacter amalonaticus]|uniref:fimbria/pilus outer membrane usher protein n=1 Tax=Citrobacter amalonaticus TaxID=35703 RepID=UPI00300C8F76